MKAFFTLSLLFAATLCLAQRQNVYFLKYNGKYVDKRDSADFIRIIREPDSASVLYNVIDLYPDGGKKLIGKSSTIDPVTFEGVCISFYKNGKKRSIYAYKKGEKTGESFDFYVNGKLYNEITIPDNKSGVQSLLKVNKDSLGNFQVTDGNGYYKGFNDKFTYIEEEGPVKNGVRDGAWKGKFENVHTTFTETYDKGNLISGTAITEDGKSTTYTKSRFVAPQFKGGYEGFGRYLGNNIKYPDYAREKNIQGRVIISFVVEKDGELTDIKVNRSVDPGLDAEAVRVLKLSPKWIPGTQFGIPAKVNFSVPVVFSLGNN